MAEWTPLGDRAIRFSRPVGPSPAALVAAIRAWPDVHDVVVTSGDVAVYFSDAPRVKAVEVDALSDLAPAAPTARTMEIAAVYDGPDLADVARAAGLSTAEVVRLHADRRYTVDTMGFAPGFAYLTGLDPRLHLPRRGTPRPRVPAGSIAIAGGYTGVYPFDSPGGWHLIGRVVDVQMFGEEGPLLALNDHVRFTT